MNASFAQWWRKHLNMLSTQVWMILFTVGMSIVMLVLFILPRPSKSSS